MIAAGLVAGAGKVIWLSIYEVFRLNPIGQLIFAMPLAEIRLRMRSGTAPFSWQWATGQFVVFTPTNGRAIVRGLEYV